MKQYHMLYQTTNLVNGKVYVGVHTTNNLNDSYLGSGKKLCEAVKKYGKDNFRRDILALCQTEDEMYRMEGEIVTEEFVRDRSNYNMTVGGKIPPRPDLRGIVRSEETRAKIRAARAKQVCSDETRKKMSQTRIGLTKGYKPTEETKAKIRAARSLQVITDDHKRRIGESLKGQPKPKVKCPHCDLVGGKSAMERWHFDNCKLKEMK